MKKEIRLIKAYGKNEIGMADLPFKVSGVIISRILVGEEMGCSRCFPHGYEVINNRFSKRQRNWKRQRSRQYVAINKAWRLKIMAISKKGSRKIVVEDHEFRWRATGSEVISVVVWASDNDDCRVVAFSEYHNEWRKTGNGYTSDSQAIITNRIIREIILHVGVKHLTESKGQINLGKIEEIYDFDNAVRSA